MSESIIKQCKSLYITAFQDDEEFTDLLFDLFYDSSCRYLCEDDKVVSMLFAMDVTLDGAKGKYIYAVATDENYRGKGYMSKLFRKVSDEFKDEYDFFCLKPMSESLFDYYGRLGFEKCLKKSESFKYETNLDCKLYPLNSAKDIKAVRRALLKENFVDYSDNFIKLLLSYCDMLTDSLENPRVFAVKEKLSGKVKEVLGDKELLTEDFLNIPLLVPGDGFDFAMVKFLKCKPFENKYLGFALD